MEEKVFEGNKIIAEFAGYFEESMRHAKRLNTGYVWQEDEAEIKSLKYHSDWSAQIPVYSKLAKMMQKLASENILNHEYGMAWARLMRDHGNATFNNDPQKGFEILVENINWLNKIK